MTFDGEPPRLRTLKEQLPRQLSTALQHLPEDDPTPEELVALTQRLRAKLDERGAAADRGRRARRLPTRGPLVAVSLTFALGAAAGVLGSSAVFLALRPEPGERPLAAPASPRARPRPAAVEPPATTIAPVPRLRDAPALPQRPAHDAPSVSSVEVRAPGATSDGGPAGDRDELALLAAAQRALAGAPGVALSLVHEHEARFAQGALAQEREVVAIDALLGLGRRTEALDRAARFHRQFPESVHGRRIDVLLGRVSTQTGDHK